MLPHPLKGIYKHTLQQIKVSFIIEWKIASTSIEAFTAFVGYIRKESLTHEKLFLKWLFIQQDRDEPDRSHIAKGSSVLINDIIHSIYDDRIGYNPDETPYPVDINCYSRASQ